jgi:Chlorophyll A-B binding protein
MVAFVPAAAPLTRSAFAGSAVCSAPSAARATVSMAMSKSVPFLETPPKTVGLPGSAEFDPLLLSNYVDIKFLQEAELKHGRICMLAVLGMIVQENYSFPGVPPMLPIEAHDAFIRQGAMVQIMIAIIFFEAISCFALWETMQGKREPGYFGFDPLGLGKDSAAYKKFQVNEIRNGRLAMLGVIHIRNNPSLCRWNDAT